MKVALVSNGRENMRVVYVKKGIYAGAYARIVSEQEDRITAQVGSDIFPLRNDEFQPMLTVDQLTREIVMLSRTDKQLLFDRLNVISQD